MKKVLLIVTVFSAVLFTSCKENAAEKVKEDNVAEAANRDAKATQFAVMEFAEKEFDFGEIDNGTPVEHLFKFKNTGDAPLVIVNAKASCGCTVPEYSKTPVAPGEEGELLVKFNGRGKGTVSKTVTITANTKTGKEVIKIKASIQGDGKTNNLVKKGGNMLKTNK